MAILKKVIGFLILVFLTASIYVMLPNHVKLEVKGTSTVFSQWENGKWVPSATEYVYLYDGSTKMVASSRLVEAFNESGIITIKRTSLWKDNIKTEHTYVFDTSESDVELVPINEYLTCVNCKGKIINFEYTGFGEYNGLTQDITSPYSFGKNMKVSWQDGSYYSKVIQNKISSDKIVIKYKALTDNEVYHVRMYDPLPDASPVSINTTFGLNSTTENITAFNSSGFDASSIVWDWRSTKGQSNRLADGDMESTGITSWLLWAVPNTTKETTSPHSGLRNLKIAYNGSVSPFAFQENMFVAGKTYRVTGWVRSDGSKVGRVLIGTAGGRIFWDSSTSTNWQFFDIVATITFTSGFNLGLQLLASDAGYVEFDDVKVELVQSDAVLNMPFDVNGSVGNTSNVKDYSSYGNNGTIINSLVWNSSCGAFTGSGGCYEFDKTNGYIVIPDSMIDTSKSHTYSLWANLKETTGGKGVFGDGNGAVGDMLYMQSGTNICAYSNNTAKVCSNIGTDAWYNFVLVYDMTNISFYINGTFAGTGDAVAHADGGNFNVGTYNNGVDYIMNGSIDQVQIWNRTLSASEIAMIYSRGINDRVHSDANERGETWLACLTAFNTTTEGNTTCTDGLTIKSLPIVKSNSLTSNNANLTTGNLTIAATALDNDNDATSLVYDWRTDRGQANLLADGNMEATGTGSWVSFFANLSKSTLSPRQGLQTLNISYSDNSQCYGYQNNILVAGKTTRITGYARVSFAGAFSPVISDQTLTIWSGTSTLGWQKFDFVNTPSTTGPIYIGTSACASGRYTEWDDVKVTQMNTSDAVLNMPFDFNGSVGNTSNVKNYAQFGVNATVMNNTKWNSSCNAYAGSGGCYEFDNETNTHLLVKPAASSFLKPFSMSMWVRQDVSDANALFAHFGTGSTTAYFGRINSNPGILLYADGGVRVVYMTSVPSLGVWHHYVFQVGNNTLNSTIYVDGILNRTSLLNTTNVFTVFTEYTSLGGADSTIGTKYSFNGSMDNVQIWNRYLSANEIWELYNQSHKMLTNNLQNGDAWQVAVTPIDRYDEGNMTLSNMQGITNTCGCPLSPANWSIDMRDGCAIVDYCNISGFYMNLANTGTMSLNNTLYMKGRTGLANGVNFLWKAGAKVFRRTA